NSSYTVTFNNNGGSGTMATETDNVPTALTLNTFTRSRYSFTGWNTASNGIGTAYADGATYPFNASVTLYAQWAANSSYTVTFNNNGGSGTMATETDNVPTALTLNTFTRSRYSFTGWNTASNGIGTAYADGATYPFNASVTLYAQWAANSSYTVTFNNNGGSGTMATETDNVPTALTLNTFTRSRYSFTGWNTASNGIGTAYADGATYPFNASVTLYAQWAANSSYTVTFNNNGGSGTMATETDNVPTALTLNTFTRSRYSFTGWNTASNGIGTAYADGATYPFNASVTLYAQWAANSSYTVTFNNNGGSGTMATETDNVPTALTLNTFTRSRYSFTGWNTASNGIGTAYADGATYPFNASVTLYAQWAANSSYTVTFNNNGGSGTMATETDNVPTALTLNTFTRSRYSFTGWNTASNGIGTAYADGATYPFNASVTLYAQWAANSSYTVTFNNNGGSGTMATETDNVPTALTLNTFTRSRYSFTGWNTASNGIGTAYADGATYPFNASVTLYAQWAANSSYTVTFNNNGGSGTMATETDNVPTALTLNTFTRSRYSFTGWNTASNGIGTAYADGATYPFNASVTLYAQWAANSSYTVTFNNNGGSGTMATETDNVPTALTLNTFTRSGYSFTGWNTASNGIGTAYADGATYPFNASVTLYAQWAANSSGPPPSGPPPPSPPTVTAISPSSGPVSGGTSVSITGTGFSVSPGGTTVDFGTNVAARVSCASTTSCSAASPYASPGTVDVTVTSSNGTSTASPAEVFTYVPAPTITKITPTGGASSGGTAVTIWGTSFVGTVSVYFGGKLAKGVRVLSSSEITSISPSGSGSVFITVSALGGTSKTTAAASFS